MEELSSRGTAKTCGWGEGGGWGTYTVLTKEVRQKFSGAMENMRVGEYKIRNVWIWKWDVSLKVRTWVLKKDPVAKRCGNMVFTTENSLKNKNPAGKMTSAQELYCEVVLGSIQPYLTGHVGFVFLWVTQSLLKVMSTRILDQRFWCRIEHSHALTEHFQHRLISCSCWQRLSAKHE